MALTARTLSAAIGASDSSFGLDAATGVTAPNFTTGVGITYLLCEQEYMLVTGLTGTVVTVQRGYMGSPAVAHGVTAAVIAGLPTDFASQPIAVKATQDYGTDQQGVAGPIAAATTITAPSNFFHVTGNTAIATMNLPPGFVQGGPVTVVFDGTATWTSAGNFATTGANTTANTAVMFFYDAGTSKWYPSRMV